MDEKEFICDKMTNKTGTVQTVKTSLDTPNSLSQAQRTTELQPIHERALEYLIACRVHFGENGTLNTTAERIGAKSEEEVAEAWTFLRANGLVASRNSAMNSTVSNDTILELTEKGKRKAKKILLEKLSLAFDEIENSKKMEAEDAFIFLNSLKEAKDDLWSKGLRIKALEDTPDASVDHLSP